MKNAFGQFFKDARTRSGQTLRQFCLKNGYHAGNISRLERGLLPPPRSKVKLAAYARALGIRASREFFELAAVGAGRIPAAVLSDHELVSKLPRLLRTIQGKRFDGFQLDALIERIRRA